MLGLRSRTRDLFLRLLGVVALDAFLSLLSQVDVLIGAAGLLPARDYLRQAGGRWLELPTIFWIDCSDTALHAAAVAGAIFSLLLILDVAPRLCLVALWGLYLSFVSVGQDFLSFQWDNLLLESLFFALFIAPGRGAARNAAPHPIGVFLMLWLLLRLHVESGAAKLLSGDPTWRDLTAMVNYYETAPLPTWVAWYAHQLPLWVHKLTALVTFAVELIVPLAIFGPRTLRRLAFVLMVGLQCTVILTANYGFFNYLTIVLCVWILDDDDLAAICDRLRLARPAAGAMCVRSRLRTAVLAMCAIVLVPLSLLPFFPFLGLRAELIPARRALSTWRSVNAYHLFASMTLVRREPVLEGSNDGEHWQSYELHYEPGDPERPPPFVAPHQPRVDFVLWFLLLRGRIEAEYFQTLLDRTLNQPAVVAGLYARNPFPDSPPRWLRVAVYRYTFTDPATRHQSGAWWHRELIGYTRTLEPDGPP